jgi:hypothetical protein
MAVLDREHHHKDKAVYVHDSQMMITGIVVMVRILDYR